MLFAQLENLQDAATNRPRAQSFKHRIASDVKFLYQTFSAAKVCQNLLQMAYRAPVKSKDAPAQQQLYTNLFRFHKDSCSRNASDDVSSQPPLEIEGGRIFRLDVHGNVYAR